MFGQFSLLYNGVSLLGQRTGESQFISPMQLLLHNRKKGISREIVEEVLFENRDVENPHHALRSVIYNAKKRLERAGLPKCTYIVMEKGMLYWSEQIPVRRGRGEIRRTLQKSPGGEGRGQPPEDSGGGMPVLIPVSSWKRYSGVVWIAVGNGARHYREMFNHCVEEIVSILRERQN